MIRKVIILISIISMNFTSLLGQSDVKRINNIKRDSAHLWQEATASSEQDAYDAAKVGLLTIITEYAANNHVNAETTDVIKCNLDRYCNKITMLRGELTRVFLYIPISHLSPVVETIPAPVDGDTESDKDRITRTYENEPISEVIPAIVPEIPRAWQREIVKKLTMASDIIAANAMLARMKAEYKIKRYGPLSECRDIDNSWLILFDDSGNIKALLGPDEGERPEYISQTYKSLSDYSGLNAIWFVFAK